MVIQLWIRSLDLLKAFMKFLKTQKVSLQAFMCELACVCGCKTHDVWAEGEAACTFFFPLASAGGDLALFFFCFLCK